MIFRVRRFDPEADKRPYWRAYEVGARSDMSVIEGLFWILEHVDDTLAFVYGCRSGTCGSCAMIINGREALACRVRLDNIDHSVSIEPLRSVPIIKDLMVNMMPFAAKNDSFGPPYAATRCISCGACYSACPVVAANPDFLGPAALNRAYELSSTARGGAGSAWLARVLADGGVYACHDVGNCVTVCPKGINPFLSIQLLRNGTGRR